jgi:hypothetical protein
MKYLLLQRNLGVKIVLFDSKSEARSTKSETISNVQNANFQNKNLHMQPFRLFNILVIRILNLLRVSDFGFII